MFSFTQQAYDGTTQIKQRILDHIYFPSLHISDFDWVRDPFQECLFLEHLDLTIEDQEALIDINTDSNLKLKHAEIPLHSFWLLVEEDFPQIGQKALNVLLPFSTTYICEKQFSAMTSIKSQHRAQLSTLEHDMRVCLSSVEPRFGKLCASIQSHISH